MRTGLVWGLHGVEQTEPPVSGGLAEQTCLLYLIEQ